MKIVVGLLISFAAFASDNATLDKMLAPAANATMKNDACFELRGNKAPDVLVAMRKAMADQNLRSCATKNLRTAGAIDLLRDALKDEDPEIRAVAVLEVGMFSKTEDLPSLAKAGRDPNLLVATNAVYALAGNPDPAVLPYLEAIAEKGGLPGTQALGRLVQRNDPKAIEIARTMVASKDAPEKLAAIKVMGEMGSKQDLKLLQEIKAKDTGELSSGRGFGLMPSVSLSRAAKTAIEAIEKRGS